MTRTSDAGLPRGTPDRRLAAAGLALVVLSGAVQLPVIAWQFVRPRLDVAALVGDPEAQRRRLHAPAPYDFLREADRLMPRDAVVLIVTPGADVRRVDYVVFHRALVALTPRPVWWLAGAPSDGTWESRWWTSGSIDAVSIERERARRQASFVLGVGLPVVEGPWTLVRVADEGWIARSAASLTSTAPVTRTAPDIAGRWWLARWAMGTLSLLVPGIAFARATRSRRRRSAWLGEWAVAWMAGSGAVSIGMWWLDQAGWSIRAGVAWLTAAGTLGLVAEWRTRRSRNQASAPRDLGGASLATSFTLAWLLILMCVAAVTIVAILALGVPMAGWDAWASWGLRARTIFLEGGITRAVYGDPSRASTLPGYPLAAPLVWVWLYVWIGAADERFTGVVAVFSYLALLGFVYGGVRDRGLSSTWSLATCAAVATIPRLVTIAGFGFVDVSLAALVTGAALHLVTWIERADRGALARAALLAGLLPWTKREGAVLVAVLAVATFVLERGWRRVPTGALAITAAAAALAGPWYLVSGDTAASPAQFVVPAPAAFLASIARLPAIAVAAARELTSPAWSFVWPVTLVMVLATRRGRRIGADTLPPCAAASYLVLIAAAYMFSDYRPFTQHMANSFSRIAAHVGALPLVWLAWRVRPRAGQAHRLSSGRTIDLESAGS